MSAREAKEDEKLITEDKKEEEPQLIKEPEVKFKPNPEPKGVKKMRTMKAQSMKNLGAAAIFANKFKMQIKQTIKQEIRTFSQIL